MKSNRLKGISLVVLLVFSSISVMAQDVVTRADDDIYMFNPLPKYHGLHIYKQGMSCGPLGGGIRLQQYVPEDTVTVYGVALTMRNTNQNGSFDSIIPTYRAVLMERAAGMSDVTPHSVTFRPLQFVDSITLHPDNIKQCLFRYEFDWPTEYTTERPCVEFYFNTPMRINRMTDTFYVGRYYFDYYDATFFPSEFVGLFNEPGPCEFWYVAYEDTTQFTLQSDHGPSFWGFAFPIIGFRCKPLDEENHSLQLTDVDGDSATVQWYSVEEGAAYNVHLTSADGIVDTVVVTEDSTYTFRGLPDNMRYYVQVRKQCHYATVNYDTMVYSPWTTAYTSFVLGEPCPMTNNIQVVQEGYTASVTWDNMANYTRVLLRYGALNLPETLWPVVDVIGDTSYTITDLVPGLRYGVSLHALCEDVEGETGWSDPLTFYVADTTGSGTAIEEWRAENGGWRVSPNPVHGVAEVTLSQAVEGAELTLSDAGGREVRREQVKGTVHRLDVSALPAGVYFLRLTTPQGVATRRLVVE